MRKDIDEIYRQLSAQQQDLDTADVWNRIDDSLDLEQLWPRLDNYLTRYRRRKIAGFTLVSLLIPVSMYLIYLVGWNNPQITLADQTPLSDTMQREISQVGRDPMVTLNYLSDNSGTVQNSNGNIDSQSGTTNSKGANQNRHHSLEGSVTSDVIKLTNTEGNVEPSKEMVALNEAVQTSRESSFAPLTVRPYYLTRGNATGNLATREYSETDVSSNTKRYYLNFTAGAKTTWLLNNHMYKSLQKESFEYLQRQYYPVASIGFGMLMNDKLSVEGNLAFLDFGGQHVNYLSEGKSVQLQTRLRYTTLEIIGGYQSKRGLHPFHFNVYPVAYLGVYSSALIHSKIITNELNADRNKSFRPVDFGVICRIAFALPVGDKFQLQAGIGVQSGVVNISRKQANVPSYFDRSFNASSTAFISGKYFF